MVKIKFEKCDKCGKPLTKSKFPMMRMTRISTTTLLGFGPYSYVSDEIELCDDCTKLFEKFIQL